MQLNHYLQQWFALSDSATDMVRMVNNLHAPICRDPEMKQTKKGNQRCFGMKAHIGVDADSGLVHRAVCTAAAVTHVTQAGPLLYGDEKVAGGGTGYRGYTNCLRHRGRPGTCPCQGGGASSTRTSIRSPSPSRPRSLRPACEPGEERVRSGRKAARGTKCTR